MSVFSSVNRSELISESSRRSYSIANKVLVSIETDFNFGRMISAPTQKISIIYSIFFIISSTLSHFLRKFSPQKHSRTARLERFALLLVSSPQHLASSAAGGASVLRPFKGSL